MLTATDRKLTGKQETDRKLFPMTNLACFSFSTIGFSRSFLKIEAILRRANFKDVTRYYVEYKAGSAARPCFQI